MLLSSLSPSAAIIVMHYFYAEGDREPKLMSFILIRTNKKVDLKRRKKSSPPPPPPPFCYKTMKTNVFFRRFSPSYVPCLLTVAAILWCLKRKTTNNNNTPPPPTPTPTHFDNSQNFQILTFVDDLPWNRKLTQKQEALQTKLIRLPYRATRMRAKERKGGVVGERKKKTKRKKKKKGVSRVQFAESMLTGQGKCCPSMSK